MCPASQEVELLRVDGKLERRCDFEPAPERKFTGRVIFVSNPIGALETGNDAAVVGIGTGGPIDRLREMSAPSMLQNQREDVPCASSPSSQQNA
jgi:hypothetical protein